MKMEGKSVVLCPEGRIDSGNAGEWDAAIQKAMAAHPGAPLILDFGRVEYISSAGLRVLLGIARKAEAPLTVRDVSPEIYDTFDITGFTSLMRVERRMRRVDITGCEIIGRGAIGTVYRLDADTIVKVYDAPDALEMIRNEQRRAKQALIKGIPTAISFDAVRVGDRYGSVFEMVNAKTFNDWLVESPKDADEIIRRYVQVIRRIHAIEAEPGELPDSRKTYLGYLDAIGDALPEALAGRLRALFEGMREDRHLIHGDFHMDNLMLSGDEPLLIDMDTLCTGNPVFDFAGIFVAYMAFNADEPGNSEAFLGIPEAMSDRIWRTSLKEYFDACDGAALREKANRAMIVGYVRFLYLLVALRLGGEEELRKRRIRHALRDLTALLADVQGLEI